MGFVRRLVEMLLQAGISSRVGRNDERRVFSTLPPLRLSHKNAVHFCGSPIRGDKGGIVNAKCRTGRTIPQSLRDSSLYTREPFLCHPEHGTQWSGGIPLQVIRSSRVGRNDKEQSLLSITRASKIAFCASAPHLRIPAFLRKRECAGVINVANCPRRGKPIVSRSAACNGCSSPSRRFFSSV